jgi:hypothetical protein
MKALTHIVLGNARYSPGDEISREELKGAGQTEEQIEALVKAGSLGEEGDSLHADHIQPEPEPGIITASDGGGGNE